MYQSDCYNNNTMHWICHHCMAKPMHCFSIVRPKPMHNVTNSLHCSMPKPMRKHTALRLHHMPKLLHNNYACRAKPPGGGFSNYFLTECAARGLPPLPISKDFVFTKKWMNRHFFRNFRKSRPISKRFIYLFFTLKMTDFTIFSQILWNGTSFKDIFDQSGTHA